MVWKLVETQFGLVGWDAHLAVKIRLDFKVVDHVAITVRNLRLVGALVLLVLIVLNLF